MAYHTHWSEHAREYTNLDDMLTDGFVATDQAYLAAAAVFRQNPRPEKIVLGREANTALQGVRFTPLLAQLRGSYEMSITLNGMRLPITTDASPTVAEVCSALCKAIQPDAWGAAGPYLAGAYVKNDTAPVKVYRCTQAGTSAGSGGPTGTGSSITDGTCKWAYVQALPASTVTDGTTHFEVDQHAVGDPFGVYVDDRQMFDAEWYGNNGTTDHGIAEDIANVRKENDEWYCLICSNVSPTVQEAAAAYIETIRRIHILASPNTATMDAGSSSDVAAVLAAAGYARTSGVYHPKANTQFIAAGMAGVVLPPEPGSITWKFKTVVGCDPVYLTTTEETNLENKSFNHYQTVNGEDIWQQGVSSADEFMDIVQGVDWMTARMKERIFARLKAANKIPFTDKGVGVVEAEVRAQLNEAVGKEVLNEGTTSVTVPLVKNVSQANKANRLLPDVKFAGQLAGAIHAVQVTGTVTV
jgi:hypothetical protein